MPFIETGIDELLIFEPKVFGDDRGCFFESFNKKTFENAGVSNVWVQDNQAYSSKGVLRGLHYQVAPFTQAKLVRVLEGEVLDVVVDIRMGSKTYGESFSLILNAEKNNQLYIPRGFAHGYVVLSETASFFYKCDNFYSKEHEAGIQPNCPNLNIDWQFDLDKAKIADRDRNFPSFGKHVPV